MMSMELLLEYLKTLVEEIVEYGVEWLSRYEFFLHWDYYERLLSKYFSVPGFIAGLVFLALLYFAGESHSKTGFFRILPFVAVINSCYTVAGAAYRHFGLSNSYNWDIPFGETENLLAGFLLILTVTSCFRHNSGRAFLFSMAVFAARPLMNITPILSGSYLNSVELIFLIIRVLIASLICSAASKKEYFHIAWLYYGAGNLLIKLLTQILPPLIWSRSLSGLSLTAFLQYYRQFLPEYAVFVLIFVFALLFERLVLKETTVRKKKAV